MTFTAPPTRGAHVVKPFESQDQNDVQRLLRDLPLDYPGSRAWLTRRLADVLAGEATCWVAQDAGSGESSDGRAAGVVILTPKAAAMKVSTIFVAEPSRGLGLGAHLLDRALDSARLHAQSETFVTVAEHKERVLRPLLDSRGFTRTARERHRYGRGRHELVFTRLDS